MVSDSMFPALSYSSGRLFVAASNEMSWLYGLVTGTSTASPILSENKRDKQVDAESRGLVLAAALSKSGSFLAFCNDFKEVFLYSLEDDVAGGGTSLKLLSTRDTAKKGVKIIFSKDESCFLMADKFGDVVSFSVGKPEEEGSVILGHLSILMDMCLICEDKMIVTADRDEKIRVSHYPHTYNIQAFCLGHTSFVTCTVSTGSNIISASADGTIKLWDPNTGEVLSSISCEGKGRFIHQLSFHPSSSSLLCLESCSCVLLRLFVSQSELKLVDTIELSSSGMAMVTVENGVVVLTDSDKQPLQYVSHDNQEDTAIQKGLDFVNSHLQQNSHMFKGCLETLKEHYTNLSKITLENVEAQMEKKSKRTIALTEDNNQTKVAKLVQ